jgi:hypothetical protein
MTAYVRIPREMTNEARSATMMEEMKSPGVGSLKN